MKKQLIIFAFGIGLLNLVFAHAGEFPLETVSRLPDGSLFVPKAMQRQLGLRTSVAEVGEFPRVLELNGQIVPDPNAGGRVQTTQSGRISAGKEGLPVLGQSVKKGQILAWLTPASTAIEQSTQQASIAELRAQEEQLVKRVERLHLLQDSVARKEVEQAEIELRAFRERKQAMQKGLQPEALRAPVSGVISAVNVVVGQVAEAREIVFEVLDPQRLAVEAQLFASATPPSFSTAYALVTEGIRLPLQFVGIGRSLKAHAMPALFRVQGDGKQPLPLVAVGQTVKVLAVTQEQQHGVAIPSQAVVRNANNETIVWLHQDAERFMPQRVTPIPLDGQRVRLERSAAGLQGKERVVSQGAATLGQFR